MVTEVKRSTVIIEIFDGWVVAYQKQNTICVLQQGGAENHFQFSLPDSALSRKIINDFAPKSKKCIVVLGRSYWNVLIDQHQGLSKREAQFASELAKEAIVENLAEKSITIQAINIAKGQEKLASITTASLTMSQVKALQLWVRSLGLELNEIRLSSFNFVKKCTTNTLCIAQYPNSWEVHLISDGVLRNTFASSVLTSKELTKVLTLMTLDYLSNGEARDWIDLPDSLELTDKNFYCELHVYGETTDLLESAISTWRDILSGFGVTLQLSKMEKTTGLSDDSLYWPVVLETEGKKPSKSICPSIRLNMLGETKLKYPFSLIQTLLAVFLVISLGLISLMYWNQHQIQKINSGLEDMGLVLSGEDVNESRRSEQVEKTIYAENFLDQRLIQMDALHKIITLLPPATTIERITFFEENVDLVLESESLSNAMIALERSVHFPSITALSPIMRTRSQEKEIERVSLRLNYAKKEGQ